MSDENSTLTKTSNTCHNSACFSSALIQRTVRPMSTGGGFSGGMRLSGNTHTDLIQKLPSSSNGSAPYNTDSQQLVYFFSILQECCRAGTYVTHCHKPCSWSCFAMCYISTMISFLKIGTASLYLCKAVYIVCHWEKS